MAALAAAGNIVGAFLALVALGVVLSVVAEWDTRRSRKAALDEISIALGVPVEELDNAEHHSTLVQLSAQRFSSELLRNRLSDLCGWVQMVWGWLSNLLQVVMLLVVIWYTVTDNLASSVYAWWIVAIALFFWITSVLFALACKLLTGRAPGQAREARRSLAVFVRLRRQESQQTP